jgi:two-component system cell cycle sensor histidine kinase/response regulator CckA
VVDLNEAVRSIAPLLRRLVGSRVEVELALEQPGRRVLVDPAQLDQVIMNLAANARDAMPEGGTLRIATGHRLVLRAGGEGPAAAPQAGAGGPHAGTLPPGRWVVLEVADTGRGIPPDALARIFEPFFTTRPEQGGHGLGLATVQGIVAQSGGHVAVESQPGQGTCFRIHLPRQDAPAEAPPAAPALPPRRMGRGTVLLVEDEAPLRRLTTRLLERHDLHVVGAETAEEALALVEAGPAPSLLISDVAMPGMDGVTLARRLRQTWPLLPVILVSGYAPPTLGPGPDREGFHVLGKPHAPAELLRLVASVLATLHA